MKEKDKFDKIEKFDKRLINKLNSFATAKSWSDLLPLMKDILSILTKNNEFDFNKISDKKLFSKRLAQGLNPENPSGLHEIMIDIYEIVLKNIMSNHSNTLMDNLYYYAYGLFPFFPNASNQNKEKFIDKILNPIFLKLNKDELKLCLPGLLSSLIPGLEENEQMVQTISRVFDKIISNNNGEMEKDFFGVYWMLLLRCEHLRKGGIIYLLEKIIKNSELQDIKEEDKKKDLITKQFPNINLTIVNALCEIIKDRDSVTVRNGMEFIMTRLPLTKANDMINDDAKINLIISGLHLLIKDDQTTIRRLKNWILGVNDQDDEDFDFDSEDMKYKMNLVIKAIEILFDINKNYSEKILCDNLIMVKNLFILDEEFIKLILPDTAYTILKCVVNFWQIELDYSENIEKKGIIEHTKEFFERNKECYDFLWKSLANSINKLSKEENFNSEPKINEVIESLKFCLLFFEMKSNDNRIEYYFPLITNLLDVIKNIPSKRENFKKIKQLVLIILALVKSLQEAKFHGAKNEPIILENYIQLGDDKYSQSEMEKERINKINDEENKNSILFEIYDKVPDEKDENRLVIRPSVSLLNEINNEENIKNEEDNDDAYNICEGSNLQGILKNKLFIQLMNELSENIVKFQEYYIKILNEYSVIGGKVTKFEVLFFRQCAELTIRLQEYSQAKEDEIPQWIKYLEKIIFQANDSNNILSIEAADILLDLNLSSSLKSKIFEEIKKNFKTEEIDKEIISVINIEDIKKRINVQNNCFELLLGKFYLLSNKQNNQTMIMDLLLKMYLLDKNKFNEIINETFNTDEYLIENIKLFNNFWKLTNEYYPEEKFFEKAECILKMVDLIDDKNPVLRHLSKTWLNQTNQCYDKIVDPIIQILLDNQLIFEDKKDENVEFLKEFDTSKILNSFNKLKNIILTCEIFPSLKKKKPEQKLVSMLKFEYFESNKLYYPQILVSIALHYIKTKSKDNLDEKFKKDVLTVNAASCEFLEFLLNNINDPLFLLENHRVINITIINLLKMYLKKQDEVMPALLLDVLKALFFKCPLEIIKKPFNKSKYINILKDGFLINTLITGMTNEHFYIREHFLSFTKKCIETFISIITIEDKAELQNFYSLCNKYIQPLSNSLINRIIINNEEKEDTEKFSHYDKNNNNIIFKNYCEEYKEYKTYEENDILSILNSINVIIKNCFKNEILEKSNKAGSNKNVKLFSIIAIPFIKKKALRTKLNLSNDWIAFKKELVNGLKANNPFLSFLTTAIIDYTDKKPNKEISDMPTNLYDNQISNLLKSFLTVWINQSDKYELNDYCLNPNGILPLPQNSSKKYLNEDQISKAKESIKSNRIKQHILGIVMNLFITDSIKFIESIIDLWCSDNNDNLGDKSINDKQFKLSIIELLISMDIPIDIILYCVGVVLQNKIVIKKDIYKKVGKDYETPFEKNIFEAKVFHFIYSYILLNPNRYISKKYENDINEIWKELYTILINTINGTKIIYTYCWIYELMRLCSGKFNFDSVDKETKANIENILNIITSKLMDAAFSDKLECKYLSKNVLVLPILPHIYSNIINILFKEDNLYKKNLEGSNKKKNGSKIDNNINNNNNISLFFSETITPDSIERSSYSRRSKTSLDISLNKINPIKEETNELSKFYEFYINNTINRKINNNVEVIELLPPNTLNQIYQRLALIMLKENYYPMVKNLFHDNLNSTRKYYNDLINKLLHLIKGKKDIFKSQFANECLAYLMEKSPKNIYNCAKDPLMEYIKSPQLFNVSQRELHESKIIISKLADEYQDILKDLINEMNDKNLFKKISDEDKRKILRRVSFVIYSCEKDKFKKNFGLIRNKAIELLTDYTDNNLLEGEIFLIMRMLFLRFSHEGVMQMIRDLWPIIFTELIKNIQDKARNKNFDFYILLESFKFVELLSLVNIEEFSLYQWIFLLDTYDMNDLDIKNENSLLKRLLNKNNKFFRPLCLEAFAGNDISFNPKKEEGEHKGKSELYIIAQNEKTLKEKIRDFFYSIGDMNSYKVEVNYEQIEDTIENDFLNMKRGIK